MITLTPRQREIIGLVANGKTNKEIAMVLGVSHNTIRVHIKRIMELLDAANRAHIVYKYYVGGK